MFDASDVEITGTSIVYDGEAHGITAQAEDAEAMYSSALNASYTSECPTYTNVGTYSIYYKISKEGYHDYYGVGTLEILPKKINTTIELTAPVANAAPMLNVENEESANDSFATAVAWALRYNITSGTSATTFSPWDTCTRGQIVTFLKEHETENKTKTMVRNITGGVHGVCDRGIVRGRTDGMGRDIDRQRISPCGGVSADGGLVRQTCRGDRYADAL